MKNKEIKYITIKEIYIQIILKLISIETSLAVINAMYGLDETKNWENWGSHIINCTSNFLYNILTLKEVKKHVWL